MSVEALHHVWTLDEYLDLPDREGYKYELLDGMVLVTPPPVDDHQWVGSRLLVRLTVAAPPHLGAVHEIGIRVPAGLLIPDVCVVRRGAPRDRYQSDGIVLVVEVESPNTRRRDRVYKADAYAEAGIPHYWRIEWDAAGRPVLVLSELTGEHYVEKQRLLPGEVGRIERPFPMSFDPADLLS